MREMSSRSTMSRSIRSAPRLIGFEHAPARLAEVAPLVQQRLGEALHHRHRRLELVSGDGDELVLQALELAQLGDVTRHQDRAGDAVVDADGRRADAQHGVARFARHADRLVDVDHDLSRQRQRQRHLLERERLAAVVAQLPARRDLLQPETKRGAAVPAEQAQARLIGEANLPIAVGHQHRLHHGVEDAAQLGRLLLGLLRRLLLPLQGADPIGIVGDRHGDAAALGAEQGGVGVDAERAEKGDAPQRNAALGHVAIGVQPAALQLGIELAHGLADDLVARPTDERLESRIDIEEAVIDGSAGRIGNDLVERQPRRQLAEQRAVALLALAQTNIGGAELGGPLTHVHFQALVERLQQPFGLPPTVDRRAELEIGGDEVIVGALEPGLVEDLAAQKGGREGEQVLHVVLEHERRDVQSVDADDPDSLAARQERIEPGIGVGELGGQHAGLGEVALELERLQRATNHANLVVGQLVEAGPLAERVGEVQFGVDPIIEQDVAAADALDDARQEPLDRVLEPGRPDGDLPHEVAEQLEVGLLRGQPPQALLHAVAGAALLVREAAFALHVQGPAPPNS